MLQERVASVLFGMVIILEIDTWKVESECSSISNACVFVFTWSHTGLKKKKKPLLMQTVNVIVLLLIIGVRISPRQLQ